MSPLLISLVKEADTRAFLFPAEGTKSLARHIYYDCMQIIVVGVSYLVGHLAVCRTVNCLTCTCLMFTHLLRREACRLKINFHLQHATDLHVLLFQNNETKSEYSQMKIPEGIEDKHYDNFSLLFKFSALGLHQENKNLILQLSDMMKAKGRKFEQE